MRLPSGIDEELELLDHLSSPELEGRIQQEERQRTLLSGARSRGSNSSARTSGQVGYVGSDGSLPAPQQWGASLSRRRRESKPTPALDSDGLAYYSPGEFRRAFPNKGRDGESL